MNSPVEPNTSNDPNDLVVIRRDRIDRINKLASRIGYAMWVVSTITFFAGLWTNLTSVMHAISGVTLIVGSVILAPSIVITYGIRAARREDAATQKKEDS
jgi:energy-converting hydrogenase Eha subunit G